MSGQQEHQAYRAGDRSPQRFRESRPEVCSAQGAPTRADESAADAVRGDELARELARELSHRMKNMFAVIGCIVNFTGRTRGIESEAGEINQRIQALGRAYEATLDEASSGEIEVGQAIRSVVAPYDPEGGRIRFIGDGLRSDFAAVSVLGLALNELAAKAAKHGALSHAAGGVTIRWGRSAAPGLPMIVIDWTEHGGPPVDAIAGAHAAGAAGLVDRMLDMARGTIAREWCRDGLRATLRLPLREGMA